ncbi:ATP-binding protein [Mucilaginibacter sp. CSA2-8R]|uniref:PAS domain-containing sensor histidine kinase n=1 Tax=Mucilaginibacter sp. CSA2-8R TaxID=3141542 RepID=UPI00315CA8D7
MPSTRGLSADTIRALETIPGQYLILSPDLHIITASEQFLHSAGTTREAITGKYIFDAFPANPAASNADGVRNIAASLQEVIHTRKPHYMSVQRYDVPDAAHPGKFLMRYWNPSHTPVLDDDGELLYIIQKAVNVTEKVLIEAALAQSKAQELQTLAHVEALNYELAGSNAELKESREALLGLYLDLEHRVDERTHELAESKERYKSLIAFSPVPKKVLTGKNLVLETVNEAMLKLLGQNSDIVGKPILEIFPEFAGQPIVEACKHVYRTGKPFNSNEVYLNLSRDGYIQDCYLNISCRAIYEGSKIFGVLCTAIDVTEQVKSRLALQQSELRFRQALESGDMGAWSINIETMKLTVSDIGRKIFGFDPNGELTLDDNIAAMEPDYRQPLINNLNNAIEKHESSDVEYPITQLQTGERRWIRATGKLFFDSTGKAVEYSGMMSDVTERKLNDQRKNDFIGMASHELKTPLTSLNAYLQMLQAKAIKAEDAFTANALDKATNQVKKMTTLINGFLNVSRLESGKIYINHQRFDMAALVKEVEDEARVMVNTHRIIFAPVEETIVVADRDKIGQVINNFISNAVKYSPLSSTVHVACTAENGMACVSVRDAGFGISAEDQAKLFERYYRVESQQTQTIAGFGIGLYLCAEIIHRHDGKIWVDSEQGQGSTFYFSIPLAS